MEDIVHVLASFCRRLLFSRVPFDLAQITTFPCPSTTAPVDLAA
jgi:hypothetical protein